MKTTIAGIVKIPDNDENACTGFLNLSVKVYQVTLNTEKPLLTLPVDETGKFTGEIQYEKGFSLIARLYLQLSEQQVQEILIDESGPHCYGSILSINFTYHPDKQGIPLFNRIKNSVSKQLGNLLLKDLNEQQRMKLLCLACIRELDLNRLLNANRLYTELQSEIGYCKRKIDVALKQKEAEQEYLNKAASDLQKISSNIETEGVLFALAGTISGSELHSVLTLSKNNIIAALEKAANENVIYKSSLFEDIAEGLVVIRNCLLMNSFYDNRFYDAKIIHLSSLQLFKKSDLLDLTIDAGSLQSLLSDEEESGDEPLTQKPAGDIAKGGAKINADIPNNDELKKIIEIDLILNQFPPLLELSVQESAKLPGHLDEEMLIKKDLDSWLKSIKSIKGAAKYPEKYKESDNPEESYAIDIVQAFSEKYPSQSLAVNLGKTKMPGIEQILVILNKNKDFNISKQSANTFFTVSKEPNKPREIKQEDLTRLQSLQRCYKLTEGFSGINQLEALVSSGLDSAHRIVTMGRFDFADKMQKRGLSRKEADFIFCRAKSINDTVTHLAVLYQRFESKDAMLPGIMRNGNSNQPPAAAGLPDMKSIFGSLDTCTCNQCQSVFSPSAYLTDLLHWIKSDVVCENTGKNGYSALTGNSSKTRRGDISYIKLNCKNAETELPYIDLVNEILTLNIEPNADYSLLQTNNSSEELFVQPEHRYDAIEAKLMDYSYTWKLPFDVKLAESQKYLSELGTTHAELIRTYSHPDSHFNTIYWAKAFLGINENEYKILIGNNAAGASFWPKHWGLSSSSNNVGEILRKSGLTLDELEDIIRSTYVKGNAAITILRPQNGPDDCNTDAFTFAPAITSAVAERLMKFERLRRISKLSIFELDKAIESFGNVINEEFIIKLASAIYLKDKINKTFIEVLIFCSDKPFFDNIKNSWTEYYADKYCNNSFSDIVKTFFDPVTLDSSSNTKKIKSLIPDEKAIICFALKIDEQELDAIVNCNFPSSNPVLTTGVISDLEAYCILADVLTLSIKELISFISMSGNPFSANPVNPAQIIKFIDKYLEFKKLCILPTAFYDIDRGKGYFELDNQGKAVDPDFEKVARDAWEKMELALTETRNQYPSGYDVNNQPIIENGEQLAPYLEDVISRYLGELLGIKDYIVKELVNFYNPVWFNIFIDDKDRIWELLPDEVLLPEEIVVSNQFTSLYRYLLRISIIKNLCSLSALGLESGIEIKIHNHLQIPNDSFYWLDKDYLVSNLEHLIWLKNAALQSEFLDIQQNEYFQKVSDLLNNIGNLPEDLYIVSGQNSCIKEMSNDDFIDMFEKTQVVTSSTADLIKIMNSLISIYNLSKKIDIKYSESWKWIWSTTSTGGYTESNISDFRENIRGHLRNKYSEFNSWSKYIIPIHNKFRSDLRDALVSFYIGQRGFKNESSIFDHFLFDAEMEPCRKTTRILMAISSVQLLIHRSLMGLETDVCMDEDDKNEWEWRKNYRVWEANRKIFLYPENWIEPSLRLDKSPFFKEAEDLLQQDEINDNNCEKAYFNYLSNLNEAARLDIRGTYIETDPEEKIHVIARTWNAPYAYYYRYRTKNKWSAWEKIEQDIEGDHIIPVVFNRRLHLFWPVFIEKEHRKIKRIIDGEEQNAPYYEIKICYSRLEFGKWTGKKILDGTVLAGHYCGPDAFNNIYRKLGTDELRKGARLAENFETYAHVSLDKNSFYFWGEKTNPGNDLIINCRREFAKEWETYHTGYTELAFEDRFLITSCSNKVEIIPAVIDTTWPAILIARPNQTIPKAMQMLQGVDRIDTESLENGLFVKNIRAHVGGSLKIFRNTNSKFMLTYPHQYKDAMWNSPFFFSDKKHSFFIERNISVKCQCYFKRTGNKFEYVCENVSAQGNKFIVQSFEHPFVCLMLSELNKYGITGLLNSKNPDIRRQTKIVNKFNQEYLPVYSYIANPYPKDEYDFSYNGAYSQYNWEVFFHLVSLIARELKNNNKFSEAIKWLQFVFDPTNHENAFGNLRYWMIKPFMQDVSDGSIQNLMRLLSGNALSNEEETKKKELCAQIEDWRDNPFEPHRIASMRNRAYMLWVYMEYIQTLLDWADHLFTQFTTESINEASNLYIMAFNLLGEKPKKINKNNTTSFCYNDLLNGLDPFSNVSVNIESQLTGAEFYNNCMCNSNSYNISKNYSLPNLLFCIPENPKLLEYWEKVNDRLFKIRNCRDINGNIREVPLFQPPIDPALLVRATAMGLDISEVLEDLATPPLNYRYSFLIQKANEFCGEVKALGGQLLSAFEKRDAEELSLIRQLHEQNILKASKNLKKLQLEEAKNNLNSLMHNKKLIEIRLNDYQGRAYISSKELNTIQQTKVAEGLVYGEQALNAVSGVMVAIPDLFVGAPTASGAQVFGGKKLHKSIQASASILGLLASVYRNKASMSATYANYERRYEDWALQIKTANEELKQIEKQILGAEIRIALAEKELENHELQQEQSKEIYDWMKSKFTNQQLYTWMSGELMKLHRKAYELAYDMAKHAQKAYQNELGRTEAPVVFGNWDSGRKGLLAGERLSVQLKELDSMYIKNNNREYELTKSISLKLLDPQQLVELVKEGKCTINLPEWLFNLEFPDKKLYAMRIKSVAVSLPCITGPHTSTNIKLSLKNHWIGWNVSDTTVNYSATFDEIITSSSNNDPAVFEANLRDERYMPFENKGVVSQWDISLPNQHDFDYSTISDLILHVRYVAKGGNTISSSTIPINAKQLMSWRHDFPQEWHLLHNFDIEKGIGSDYDKLENKCPVLTTEHISYQMRLAGKNTGSVEKLYYSYKDDNGEIKIVQIAVDSIIQIENGIIKIGNKKVEDIWIIYKLEP
ncbi:MAG: hypothetical protein J0M37_15455 [Ignavibacteria bacterium]|nr:hypothetical protein [Ignavibacteria bacterium]